MTHETKLLAFLLSILIFGSAISTVKADVTREYTKDSYDWYGNLRFTYKVKIIIETEENGVWLVGSTYRITFTITLTYLNQSMFSPYGFYIVFHSPSGIYVENREILTNSTSLSLGKSGYISVQVSEKGERRVTLEPLMFYEMYVDNKFFEGGDWSSNEPIYINVKSPSKPSPPSLFPPELIFMAIGIVLGAVLTFLIKARKKRGER